MAYQNTFNQISYTIINSNGTYRYKRDKLLFVIEGKRNNIKTVILNLNDIAKYLKTNIDYIIKFLSIKLGVICIIDKLFRVSIRGIHNIKELENLINMYIALYVICPSCKLPGLTNSFDVANLMCVTCRKSIKLNSNDEIENYIIKNNKKLKNTSYKN